MMEDKISRQINVITFPIICDLLPLFHLKYLSRIFGKFILGLILLGAKFEAMLDYSILCICITIATLQHPAQYTQYICTT